MKLQVLYGRMKKRVLKSCNIYTLDSPVVLPNGVSTCEIVGRGAGNVYLPSYKVSYRLCGKFNEECEFLVSSYEELIPQNPGDMVEYLSTFPGLGLSSAKKLVEQYGPGLYDIIKDTPEKLLEQRGFNKERVAKLSNSFAERTYAKKLFEDFHHFYIDKSLLRTVYLEYEDEAIQTLRRNPYPHLPFDKAEKVAKANGLDITSKSRLEAAILETISQGENGGDLFTSRIPFPAFCKPDFISDAEYAWMKKVDLADYQGSTCFDTSVLYLVSLKLLGYEVDRDRFQKALASLLCAKKILMHDFEGKTYVYRRRTAKAEFNAAKLVASLNSVRFEHDPLIYRTINRHEAELKIKLSFEQTNAVVMVIENGFSVLTGGPGTGKTSVQKVLISTFTEVYPDDKILLVAPTGRAAKRMSESTGYPASTIHRALNLKDGSSQEAMDELPESYFDAGLIIVDESSMMDSYLFECFLKHVAPGTHLVLVGDVAQLPSIGAGCVLRELIEDSVAPVTRLTKTFRQAEGSSIISNAARINTGEPQLAYGPDFELHGMDSEDDMAEDVCSLFKELASSDGLDRVTCLTSFRRRTKTGADALNIRIRDALKGRELGSTPFFESNDKKIYEGDRVMFTKNAFGLTNGEQGYVTEISTARGHTNVKCDFGDQIVELSDEALEHLDLAFATTIHKSQGSEYPVVIMVVDPQHERMLKRNLIYTGITRAKEKIFIIGDEDALSRGVLKDTSSFRTSFLGSLVEKY